jgi:hypothetical protein
MNITISEFYLDLQNSHCSLFINPSILVDIKVFTNRRDFC